MSVRLLNYRGDAFYDNSTKTAYAICPDQPSQGTADFAPSQQDVYNIEGVHHRDLDIDIDADEVAVIRYAALTDVQPYSGSLDHGAVYFTFTEDMVDTKPHVFTAPSSGRIFFWAGSNTMGQLTDLMGNASARAGINEKSFKNSRTILTAAGTKWYLQDYDGTAMASWLADTTCFWAFRPDVWPS